MAKIGSYEYPTTQFATLLKAAEVLVEKFDGSAKDEKTFAEALGHKTHNSGGWRTKLGDMRKYGLLEPRSLDATQTAKRIAKPLNAEERQQEINKSIMSISLWQALYDKLKKKLPEASDFKITLVQVTNDRDGAVDSSEDIRNLYKDALSFFSENSTVKKDEDNGQTEGYKGNSEGKDVPNTPPIGKNMIDGKLGNVYIQMPKDGVSIEIARKLVDMMEIQIKSEKDSNNDLQ